MAHLALAETVWVLAAVYERTAEQIGAAVDMLLNHKELTLHACGPTLGGFPI